MWRRSCSPGDPTPQQQCAWLSLKVGEEQKEVLEAMMKRRKVKWIEKSKRRSLNVCMRHDE